MASTYTANLGIEKPATGDRDGTWGTMTNTNMDLLDQAVSGVAQVTLSTAGSSGSPTDLPITNFSVTNGRNKFIEFVDGGDLGGTAYVQLTPNDAEKIAYIRNSLSGSRSIILFQGTYNASNDIEIANGKDVVVKFNGGGASATVTNVFANLAPDAITAPLTGNVTGNLTGNVTGNVTSTGASSFSNVTLSGGTINDMQIGASAAAAGTFTGVTVTGTATLTTVDINAGNIDGTTVGGTTPGAGTFTALETTGDHVLIQTSQTPASASASGTAGEIAWDANYIYVCVATNTWKRAAISTW